MLPRPGCRPAGPPRRPAQASEDRPTPGRLRALPGDVAGRRRPARYPRAAARCAIRPDRPLVQRCYVRMSAPVPLLGEGCPAPRDHSARRRTAQRTGAEAQGCPWTRGARGRAGFTRTRAGRRGQWSRRPPRSIVGRAEDARAAVRSNARSNRSRITSGRSRSTHVHLTTCQPRSRRASSRIFSAYTTSPAV